MTTRKVMMIVMMTVTCLAVVTGVAMGVLYHVGKDLVHEMCLGDWLDQNLDKLGDRKAWIRDHLSQMGGEETLERQAEAAAYAKMHLARQRGLSLCEKPNWMAKVRAGWNHWRGEYEPRPKSVIAYRAAANAMAGTYKYPLPPEWQCITHVKFSRLRRTPPGRYIGSIANASFYCADAEPLAK